MNVSHFRLSIFFLAAAALALLGGCSSPGGFFRVRNPLAGDPKTDGGLFGPGRDRAPATPAYDRVPDASERVAPDDRYFGNQLERDLPDPSKRAHPPVSWNAPPKAAPAPATDGAITPRVTPAAGGTP